MCIWSCVWLFILVVFFLQQQMKCVYYVLGILLYWRLIVKRYNIIKVSSHCFAFQITMLSSNTESFKVIFSAKGFYVVEKRGRNDCGILKFAAHVTKQETIIRLSVICYGLHEVQLLVPGNIFLHNIRVPTKRTILLNFCGLILIYLRTFLILKLSVAIINDSEFNFIYLPAAVLCSWRIDTNLLHCNYLFVG